MKIRITKLEERDDATHPNNIEVGYVRESFMHYNELDGPMVGRRFYIDHIWSTSPVTEILSDNTFKTLNSVYKWERIQEDSSHEE